MNLGDPELELVDPTPNIHALFVQFDKIFFWTSLSSRAVVRWSKRMYSCAGTCSYEGRSGFCDIALSEPLLKLRSRKDLIETLLHEMIHAFLFVTNKDQDRDGHGPNFQGHMHRINKMAGLRISIYHNFHDEVSLYQIHWWRCNGPCQVRKPHFGVVRRAVNRAPGPYDYWWNDHLRKCGGTFVKIKEPTPKGKNKKINTSKIQADITNYIRNEIQTVHKIPNINDNSTKPVLKDSSNVQANVTNKSSATTVFVTNKVVNIVRKPVSKPIPLFTGIGNSLKTDHYTEGVTETVRNIWANKNIPTNKPLKKVDPSLKKPVKSKDTGAFIEPERVAGSSNPKKHKAEETGFQSPPTKMKKIEDYFNATTILKDLYGDDYKLTQPNNSTKLVAVNLKVELVECPVCNDKFSNEQINRHLDECLNKDIIERLSKDVMDSEPFVQETPSSHREPDTHTTLHKPKLKEAISAIPPSPAFKRLVEITPIPDSININPIDMTIKNVSTTKVNTSNPQTEASTSKNIRSETPPIPLITSVPAFKPIPPLPECSTSDVIDLTISNLDTNETNVVKSKRKTDSRGTFVPVDIDTVMSKYQIDERKNRRKTDIFIQTKRGDLLPNEIKQKAGSSGEDAFGQICPCCGKEYGEIVDEHLDECLRFFDNNTTIPTEATTSSFRNNIVFIEDDEDKDVFDESLMFNSTGTKTPCPCCMGMVEQVEMSNHLDVCLQS